MGRNFLGFGFIEWTYAVLAGRLRLAGDHTNRLNQARLCWSFKIMIAAYLASAAALSGGDS